MNRKTSVAILRRAKKSSGRGDMCSSKVKFFAAGKSYNLILSAHGRCGVRKWGELPSCWLLQQLTSPSVNDFIILILLCKHKIALSLEILSESRKTYYYKSTEAFPWLYRV